MRYFFVLLFLAATSHVHSQSPGQGNRGGPGTASGMPAEGLVTGQVIDDYSGVPMEFVNIVLFSIKDSSMITGTITDQQGKFSLQGLTYGRFYLTANFIGFERLILDSVFLNPNKKSRDVGVIRLKPAATNLEGIEIVADKDRVVYQVDKKIVNVSQDLKSAGGTAIDVLENVPSVKVDIEGNVSLRGSGNFTVLVDGRPSILDANDALQQIPAANIDHIEIITNPSAKYDPDGAAGIINVITKKRQEDGLNGIINASIGTKNKYSADVLLNYRLGKFNFFGGADYGNRQFSGKGESENETRQPDTDFTGYRFTKAENKMKRDGYGFKGGIDFFATSKSTFNLSGKYGFFGFGRDRYTWNEFTSAPVSQDYYTIAENLSRREGNFYEVTANYLQKFGDKGEKLEVMAFFSNRKSDDEENQAEFPTDPDWENPGDPVSLVRTIETGDTYDYLVKADYSLPFNEKSRLEAGYQSRFFNDTEDYEFTEFDTLTGEWILNPKYTSAFEFYRNIHSLYSTYSNEWKGFGFQAGLRGEYAARNINNTQSAEEFPMDKFDIFPSIHVSKQFLEKNQFLASYSRRINRVSGRMLDPTVSYWDPYNMRQGNPALEDEYADSYDLGYQRKFKGPSFLALEAYYRITNNKITDITTLMDDGVYLRTYENLNRDYSLGAEISGNFDVTPWLNLFASSNLYNYRLQGTLDGEEVNQQSTNWDARLTASFKFKYDIRLQFSGNYSGPSVTAQGRTEGSFMSSLSARKDFFNRKLSVTLTGRDIFRTAKYEYTTSGQGFYSYSYMQRESPVFMLNVSYRINNYRQTPQRQAENGDRNGGEEMDM